MNTDSKQRRFNETGSTTNGRIQKLSTTYEFTSLCSFWIDTCKQCIKTTISVQNNQVSILSLTNNPSSPGKPLFPGKHIISGKGMGERRIKLTDVQKSQQSSQVRQIKPMPVNQIMQRLFTFAANTLKFS